MPPPAPGDELAERLHRAWLQHPVVAFFRHRRLLTFYRQLHSVVSAGLPLPTAFAQLAEYAPDRAFRDGLQAAAREVEAGATLTGALAASGAQFDAASLELLPFAEEAGRLEPVLAGVIGQLERDQSDRWQAVAWSLWPLYLAGAAVFVGPLLGVAQVVRPGDSIAALYLAGLGRALLVAGGLAAVALGAPLAVAGLGLEARWDALKRRLPGIRGPVRHRAGARLVQGLGLGMASGLEVGRSLRLAVRSTGSPTVAEHLPRAEAALRRGASLTQAVAALEVLDRPSLGLLAVAETTGSVPEAMERLSLELQDRAQRATRLLIGVAIGVVALGLLVKIVVAILGAALGPLKDLYDAAGSGSLER